MTCVRSNYPEEPSYCVTRCIFKTTARAVNSVEESQSMREKMSNILEKDDAIATNESQSGTVGQMDVTQVVIENVLPPALDLNKIASLRQQYIDNYFTKNPASSILHLADQQQSSVRNICVNPRLISHPLYRPSISAHFLGSESIVSTLLAKSIKDSLCLEKSRAVLDLTRAGSLAVNCMALDSQNALLACGSERGIFSVYDVDEAVFAIQLQRKILVPTIVIDTKRSISSITWNSRKNHEDEVLLTFNFSCEAWLYNLSLLPEDPGYLRVLSPKVNRSGGSHCALFWDHHKVTQFVMVGGSHGYVRCFRLKNATFDGLWNIRVGNGVQSDIPIVYLHRIPASSHLMAINALGMVMIWDIDRVDAVAFSSTGREPALIYSHDFYPLILPFLATYNISEYDGLIQRVIPLESSSTVSSQSHQFNVLFRTGLLCTIDLLKKKIIDILPRYQRLSHTTPNVIGGRTNEAMTLHADALSSNRNADNTVNNQSITDMVTVTSFSANPITLLIQPIQQKSTVCSTAASTILRFLQWNNYRQLFTQRFHYQPPHPHKTGLFRTQLGTSIVESALVKCDYFSYTLPGQIVRAIPGESEIIVSHNLELHLGNVATVSSSISRSCDIRLEWLVHKDASSIDVDNNPTTSVCQRFTTVCDISSYVSQESTIVNVRAHAIVMQDKYQGPEVIDGYPRVQLRTKLQPQYHLSSINSFPFRHYPQVDNVSSFDNSSNHQVNDKDLQHNSYLLLHECEIPTSSLSMPTAGVTSLLAHPNLPLIFLGQDDGRILTLSTSRDDRFVTDDVPTSTPCLATTESSAVAEPHATSTMQAHAINSTDQVIHQPLDTMHHVQQQQNNIWRADISLSSSYNRTQTRVLEALPATRSALIQELNLQDNSRSLIDKDLQTMHNMFQRNNSDNAHIVVQEKRNIFSSISRQNSQKATTTDNIIASNNNSISHIQSEKKSSIVLLSDILGQKRKLNAVLTTQNQHQNQCNHNTQNNNSSKNISEGTASTQSMVKRPFTTATVNTVTPQSSSTALKSHTTALSKAPKVLVRTSGNMQNTQNSLSMLQKKENIRSNLPLNSNTAGSKSSSAAILPGSSSMSKFSFLSKKK